MNEQKQIVRKLVFVFDYNNVKTYSFETTSKVNEELIHSFLRVKLNLPNQQEFENINWMSKPLTENEDVNSSFSFEGKFECDTPKVHLSGVYKRLFDTRNELNNPMVSMMDDFDKIIEYLKNCGYSFQELAGTINWDEHKDYYNNEKPAYVQLDIMNPTESGMSNYCLSLTMYNSDNVNKANLYQPYLVIANDDGDYVQIDLWTPQNAFTHRDVIMGHIESAIEHFIKIHYRADF